MHKLVIPVVLSLIAGCATPTPHYDARFGDAVREAKLKMTIDPYAGSEPDAVLGMDGRTARESIILYQDTYKAPPPAVNVINIGGSIGNGK